MRLSCRQVLCGHSLGGGLATFCALALAEQIPGIQQEVYTYGGLVNGNAAYAKYPAFRTLRTFMFFQHLRTWCTA